MTGKASTAGMGRVLERRRAVALARHYREFEGLSIRQIAGRLGRSPATVKAYFYDPSDANKRPTESPQSGRLLVMHGRRSVSGYSAHAAMERGLAFRLLDLSDSSHAPRLFWPSDHCPFASGSSHAADRHVARACGRSRKPAAAECWRCLDGRFLRERSSGRVHVPDASGPVGS